MLPRPQVELAVGDRHDHLAAHDLPLVVGVGIVFAGAVVVVPLRRRIERRQLFQPLVVVAVQPRLVVVDEHAGGDVHRVDQHQAVLHAAFGDQPLDVAWIETIARRWGTFIQSSLVRVFMLQLYRSSPRPSDNQRMIDRRDIQPADLTGTWLVSNYRLATLLSWKPGRISRLFKWGFMLNSSCLYAASFGIFGCLLTAFEAEPPHWQQRLSERLPLLGHRNWIVIADSAYPLQSREGIETIATGEEHPAALKHVLAALNSSKHVRPIIHLDAELPFVAEQDAAGISAYRNSLTSLLKNQPTRSLPHEEIISKLDNSAQDI